MSSDALSADACARLDRYVRRVCPFWMADQAEDLVQMAVVKILRTGRKDPDPPYLYRVAYTTVVDEIRRRRKRNEVGMSPSMPGRLADSKLLNPESSARGAEIGFVVVDCLATLAEGRRRAVTLHLQGHTVPEVAKILQCDRKKAANLVYRGMEDLRERLVTQGMTP